jgi:hypothetical protein
LTFAVNKKFQCKISNENAEVAGQHKLLRLTFIVLHFAVEKNFNAKCPM